MIVGRPARTVDEPAGFIRNPHVMTMNEFRKPPSPEYPETWRTRYLGPEPVTRTIPESAGVIHMTDLTSILALQRGSRPSRQIMQTKHFAGESKRKPG